MAEVQQGATVLGGRYIGELTGELGARYIGGQVGDFAGTVGQAGAWFALKKLVKGPTGRMLRLGLMSELLHEVLVVHAGVDVPGQVMNLLPGAEEPAPEAPAMAPGEEVPTTAVMAGFAPRGAAEMLGQYAQEDAYDIENW